MRERSVLQIIITSIIMAGAFVFLWLNLASGPVIGIAIGASLLHLLN